MLRHLTIPTRILLLEEKMIDCGSHHEPTKLDKDCSWHGRVPQHPLIDPETQKIGINARM